MSSSDIILKKSGEFSRTSANSALPNHDPKHQVQQWPSTPVFPEYGRALNRFVIPSAVPSFHIMSTELRPPLSNAEVVNMVKKVKSNVTHKTMRKRRSCSGISPKKVLPYFMELVLSNQVRTKESEKSFALAKENRHQQESAEKLTKQLEELRLAELTVTEPGVKSESEDVSSISDPKLPENDLNEISEHRKRAKAKNVASSASSDSYEEIETNASASEGRLSGQSKFGRRARTGTTGPRILSSVGKKLNSYSKSEAGSRSDANIVYEIDDSTRRLLSRIAFRGLINNVKAEYKLPCLILKKHLYIKSQEPRLLGPGTYDPIYNTKWNGTTKGQMKSCSNRFLKEKEVSNIPGPGAYGSPHEVLERANDRHKYPGKVPLFMSGPCDLRKVLSQGTSSGLPPGYYNVKDGVTEMLNKVTSLRGPYDLYTPDRLIIPYGYNKSQTDNLLGPGQYNLRGSLKQELNMRENKYKGKMSQNQRDGKMTGERIVLVAPLWPINTGDLPGPGQYDTRPFRMEVKQNRHPFGSSIKNGQLEFNKDYDMSPDKYKPESQKYCPVGCGHRSAFKSTTNRLSPRKFTIVTERLRPKDIPLEEKIAINTR